MISIAYHGWRVACPPYHAVSDREVGLAELELSLKLVRSMELGGDSKVPVGYVATSCGTPYAEGCLRVQ